MNRGEGAFICRLMAYTQSDSLKLNCGDALCSVLVYFSAAEDATSSAAEK